MIGDEERALVKRNFSGWREVVENKAELSKEAKALIDNTATLLQVKPALVSKMFAYLKKRYDTATDELGELVGVVEDVFGESQGEDDAE